MYVLVYCQSKLTKNWSLTIETKYIYDFFVFHVESSRQLSLTLDSNYLVGALLVWIVLEKMALLMVIVGLKILRGGTPGLETIIA